MPDARRRRPRSRRELLLRPRDGGDDADEARYYEMKFRRGDGPVMRLQNFAVWAVVFATVSKSKSTHAFNFMEL